MQKVTNWCAFATAPTSRAGPVTQPTCGRKPQEHYMFGSQLLGVQHGANWCACAMAPISVAGSSLSQPAVSKIGY